MVSSQANQVYRNLIQGFVDNGELVTAFNEAIRYRLTDLIEDFLAKGISINEQDRYGGTALMFAANGANYRLVKQLLGLGADVHIRNAKRMTALHYAVSGLNREANVVKVVKLLLEAGADKKAISNDGNTPCFFARHNYSDEVVSLLSE